ncbi:hypothetical protein AB0N07_35865 [Streptomyces sp. NPDC051172]|uniref:hypothetical protein n=1 Tax=Streptomyces sp. NPDC051172 TaxID=3155796 RepID=UPI00341F7FF7
MAASEGPAVLGVPCAESRASPMVSPCHPGFGLSLLHTITASAEVQALSLLGIFVLGIAAAQILLFVPRLLTVP